MGAVLKDFLGKITDLLSLKIRQIFVMAVIAWVLRILSEARGFLTPYRQYINVGAWVATAWFFALLLIELWGWAFEQLKEKWVLHQKQLLLKRLTPREGAILRRYYIDKETQTAVFGNPKGVIYGLENKGILYQAGAYPGVFKYYYNIHRWAYDYLSKHPELLDDYQDEGMVTED
jgi:hypothetical protein